MDILNEVWVPAVGFEDSSEVSNFGNVRTIDRLIIRSNGRKCFYKGQDLKPMIRSGYPSVTLPDPISRKRTSQTIHAMVALAFIGVRPQGYCINHIDGNKLNNCVENLEYCTYSENKIHAYKNGLHNSNLGENHHSAKLTRNDVVIIRDRLAKGDSPEKIASNYGVKGSTIRNINRFRTWNHI
jgi:hypothetical protein